MRRNEKGKELEMTLIDLSFTIEEGMPVYPGDVQTKIRKLSEPQIIEAGCVAHNITMSLHAGTHIESSAHSIPGGKMLSEYPLKIFIIPFAKNMCEELIPNG